MNAQINFSKHLIFLSVVFFVVALFSSGVQAQTVDGIMSEGEYGNPAVPYKTYNECSCATSKKGVLYMKDNSIGDGYLYFAYVVSRGKNDLVYDNNSIPNTEYAGWNYTKGHQFADLKSGTYIEFKLWNNSNTLKVRVGIDFLYLQSGVYKCGTGGDANEGYINCGSINQCKTSILYNKDNAGWTSWLTNSPGYPEKNHPEWIYEVIYEFRVNANVLGSGHTFGSADITVQKDGKRCTTDIFKNTGFPTLAIDDGLVMCIDKNNNITYTFTVKNIGCQDMTSSKLTLTYDPFMSFVSSSIPPISGTSNTQFSLGTITPDETKTMTVTVHSSVNTNVQYIYLTGEVTANTNAYFNGKGPKPSCNVVVKTSTQESTQICNPLPVELVLLTAAVLNNKSVDLKWKTATEINNYGFEVQRATSGSNWIPIGFVEGHGTVNTPQNYSFSDVNAVNKGMVLKYRLKQIDRDGSIDYSPAVEINFNVKKKDFGILSAYPNPFGAATLSGNPSTVVSYYIPKSMPVSLKLYDVLGKEVMTLLTESEHAAGMHSMMIDASNLPSGTYFIWLVSDSKKAIYPITLAR